MYKFPSELTPNVYDTGSVVFQGAGATSAFALQIAVLISQINIAVQPKKSNLSLEAARRMRAASLVR